MSKQLKPSQWIKLFRLYESLGTPTVWIEYAKYKKLTESSKSWFIIKYRKYLNHNKDMNALISMSGKSPKKGTKSGRPKKDQTKHEIWKKFINQAGDDELANLLSDLVDNGDEELIKKIKEISKKTKLSSRETATILNVSKSTICNLRNNKITTKKSQSKKEWLRKAVYDLFMKNQYRCGRRPMAQLMFKLNKYAIFDRQMGRIMKQNNLFCKIREPRKVPEIKNTSFLINDLVQRDYDNLFHAFEILATDVTYIIGTYDAKEKHVYLSVVISHKTKEILGWKLSMCNDTNLVIQSFNSIKNKPAIAIVHSDHGAPYTSTYFDEMLQQNNWIQSMSRIGNCLDNRVVEFWFSILKTELISKLDIKHMSFKELEQAIANYIDYYNNVRIQGKLNWMSPVQFRNQL